MRSEMGRSAAAVPPRGSLRRPPACAPVPVDPECLGDSRRPPPRQELEGLGELVCAQRVADDLPEGAGRSAGRQRDLGERRGVSQTDSRSASRRASSSAFGVGGSSSRTRLVRRSAPMSTERSHAGSPMRVPTTTSVEPPPTSQTATLSPSVAISWTAPWKARRPSSSGERTRTPALLASSRSVTSSAPFALCLPGAVMIVSTWLAPAFRAMRANDSTRRAVSVSFWLESRPSRSTSVPSPSTAFSSRTARIRPCSR